MRRQFILASLSLALLYGATPALAGEKIAVPTGQPKQTVVIGRFDNAEIIGGDTTAFGLQAMLAEAMVKDQRFVVMEYGGPANNSTLNAGVVVFGTVTQFTPNASGVDLGIGNSGGSGIFGMIGSKAGAHATVAKVVVNLRLIDTTTSQVIYSGSASGKASSKGVDASIYTAVGMDIGTSAFLTTPLGKASQQAIDEAVQKIQLGMGKVPWSAYVISADGGSVYINAGSDRNIAVGTVLHVYRNGKQLVDPITHVVLDTLTETIGTVTIQTVRNQVSIGSISSGDIPQPGDILKLQ
jgi:curli biogenesis system outer membrane secretion channel CsgG